MRELFEKPFWGRGFRPFFTLAACYAVITVLVWVLFWGGLISAGGVFNDPVLWHGHEMIFGFTVAVIAGFLLTAVANWTGGAPARQVHLFLLCLLWLAGRVVMNRSDIPYELAAAIDLAFLPALAVSLAVPLLRSWNRRNFVFLGMLSLLFFCNLHIFVYQDKTVLYVAVIIITAMISLVGGRIIPAFTVAALRRKGEEAFQTDQPKVDMLALVSLATLAVVMIFAGADGHVTGLVSLIAAVVHIWRLRHYHTVRIWSDPMLWSLHLGYYWLIAGLCFTALAAFGLFAPTVALHALTAGTIGTMTHSMMCRVALGHTGRNLIADVGTVVSFLSMQAAAVTRAFGPLFLPDLSVIWIVVSGGFWVFAFTLYLSIYLPFLWGPRPDGRSV